MSQSSRPSVSVAMATFNGALFIQEQMTSILTQLTELDEVVVVDDASSDATVQAIEEIGDRRVRIIANPTNQGHVKAFEAAISAATGEVILLSDQDDVWSDNHVEVLVGAIHESPSGVSAAGFGSFLHGMPATVLQEERPRRLTPSLDFLALLSGQQPYYGCAMGFGQNIRRFLLPFPACVHAHDHWIAIVGMSLGGVSQREELVLSRRIHGRNVSVSNRPLRQRLRTRSEMVAMLAEARKRTGRQTPIP